MGTCVSQLATDKLIIPTGSEDKESDAEPIPLPPQLAAVASCSLFCLPDSVAEHVRSVLQRLPHNIKKLTPHQLVQAAVLGHSFDAKSFTYNTMSKEHGVSVAQHQAFWETAINV